MHTLNVAALAAALLLVGCGEQRRDTSGGTSASPSTESPPKTSAAGSASGAPIAATSASAAPSAAASAAADTARFVGTWEGRYHAKKGSVGMPGKLKDAARDADDGKAASGEGTLTLTISAEGEVSGKAKGALGEQTLRGKIEGDTIRASVYAESPNDPLAMSGMFMGTVKEGAIAAELRVSGPDATVVRESTFELKKKP